MIQGLGALFFGVFKGERELRQRLAIPGHLDLLGAIALGHPGEPTAGTSRGRSADRTRRTPEQIIHRGGWSPRPAPTDR